MTIRITDRFFLFVCATSQFFPLFPNFFTLKYWFRPDQELFFQTNGFANKIKPTKRVSCAVVLLRGNVIDLRQKRTRQHRFWYKTLPSRAPEKERKNKVKIKIKNKIEVSFCIQRSASHICILRWEIFENVFHLNMLFNWDDREKKK